MSLPLLPSSLLPLPLSHVLTDIGKVASVGESSFLDGRNRFFHEKSLVAQVTTPITHINSLPNR